ncbi:MAG: HugZ family protein [Nitratireductor sp.]|nr:HugZ family protein [Nitratireductor sp.]
MAEPDKINPIRQTDDAARALARRLIEDARFAAIAVLEPETGMPLASRVAVAVERDGSPCLLISDLSGHSKALARDGRASLLFGEPGPKGDPLTHPRITVIGRLGKLDRSDPGHAARRDFWLEKHPKARLYIDFGDFHFWRLEIERANLNGGFGKAYALSAADLRPAK